MVSTKIITKSFLKTGITNALDRSEDMLWMRKGAVNRCKRGGVVVVVVVVIVYLTTLFQHLRLYSVDF
jgi:hypothetical protein